MERRNLDPLTVAKWSAVAIGAVALGRWLGVFRSDPGPLVTGPVPDVPAPAMTRQQARALADRIYGAIYGSGGFWGGSVAEDEQAVIEALLEVTNAGDAALLVDAYGRRGGLWTLTGDLDLVTALRTYLSPGDLAGVNEHYKELKIQWAW